jgi:hypothetical protein
MIEDTKCEIVGNHDEITKWKLVISWYSLIYLLKILWPILCGLFGRNTLRLCGHFGLKGVMVEYVFRSVLMFGSEIVCW